MKNSHIYFLLFITLLASCSKIFKKEIEGELVDYYTDEGLENVHIAFDVVTGSGFLSGKEEAKYSVTTGAGGQFTLEDLGDDYKSAFYPEFNRRTLEYDTLHPVWRYRVRGPHSDSLWIDVERNKRLRLKPAGLTYFEHPVLRDSESVHDEIIIEAYHQKDTISIQDSISCAFRLLPSSFTEVTYRYLNADKTFTETKYIPVCYFKKEDGFIYRENIYFEVPE